MSEIENSLENKTIEEHEFNMIPLDTALIIEIEKVQKVSSGGINLPESLVDLEQTRITEGILVKVGDMAYSELNELNKIYPKIGDKVFFKKYSGILYYDEKSDKQYRIIQDQDIYSFIRMFFENVEELDG